MTKQHGFRDVWWCFNLNEPFIVTWNDNIPICDNCGATGRQKEVRYKKGKSLVEVAFDQNHVFIQHIEKPSR